MWPPSRGVRLESAVVGLLADAHSKFLMGVRRFLDRLIPRTRGDEEYLGIGGSYFTSFGQDSHSRALEVLRHLRYVHVALKCNLHSRVNYC